MIKQYFQQAWAQLRQQPLISAVNVAGTALSIFLIMLVVMVQQVQVEPFAPESNRDRFLHVKCGSIGNENWGEGNTSNGPMSVRSGKEMYKSLTTPEAVTLYTIGTTSTPVNVPNQPATAVDVKETDDDFWRVFDFVFVDGKPYEYGKSDNFAPTFSNWLKGVFSAAVEGMPEQYFIRVDSSVPLEELKSDAGFAEVMKSLGKLALEKKQ